MQRTSQQRFGGAAALLAVVISGLALAPARPDGSTAPKTSAAAKTDCPPWTETELCTGGHLAVNTDLARRTTDALMVSPEAKAAALDQRAALAATPHAISGTNATWKP